MLLELVLAEEESLIAQQAPSQEPQALRLLEALQLRMTYHASRHSCFELNDPVGSALLQYTVSALSCSAALVTAATNVEQLQVRPMLSGLVPLLITALSTIELRPALAAMLAVPTMLFVKAMVQHAPVRENPLAELRTAFDRCSIVGESEQVVAEDLVAEIMNDSRTMQFLEDNLLIEERERLLAELLMRSVVSFEDWQEIFRSCSVYGQQQPRVPSSSSTKQHGTANEAISVEFVETVEMPPGVCQEFSPDWKHKVTRAGAQLFRVAIGTPPECVGPNDYLQFAHGDGSIASERFTALNWPEEPVTIKSGETLVIMFHSSDWNSVSFKCVVTVVCLSNLTPVTWADDTIALSTTLASHLMSALFAFPAGCAEELKMQMRSDLLAGGVDVVALQCDPPPELQVAIERMQSLAELEPPLSASAAPADVTEHDWSLGAPAIIIPKYGRRASLAEQAAFLHQLVEGVGSAAQMDAFARTVNENPAVQGLEKLNRLLVAILLHHSSLTQDAVICAATLPSQMPSSLKSVWQRASGLRVRMASQRQHILAEEGDTAADLWLQEVLERGNLLLAATPIAHKLPVTPRPSPPPSPPLSPEPLPSPRWRIRLREAVETTRQLNQLLDVPPTIHQSRLSQIAEMIRSFLTSPTQCAETKEELARRWRSALCRTLGLQMMWMLLTMTGSSYGDERVQKASHSRVLIDFMRAFSGRHFLDGIEGCDLNLQQQVSDSFFRVYESLLVRGSVRESDPAASEHPQIGTAVQVALYSTLVIDFKQSDHDALVEAGLVPALRQLLLRWRRYRNRTSDFGSLNSSQGEKLGLMRKHSEKVESAGWLAVKALLYTACGGNRESKTVFNDQEVYLSTALCASPSASLCLSACLSLSVTAHCPHCLPASLCPSVSLSLKCLHS